MGKVCLSLLAISAILSTNVSAKNLSEALSSGKVSGDVSIYHESRNQDKEVSPYYSNTGYTMGSLGLNYKTAIYNGFSADIGFRAYSILHEDDKNFRTYHGKGDASERFYEEASSTALSKAYIAYENDKFDVKFGRQNLSSEWLDKLHDAVVINIKAFTNTGLQLIHSNARGRVRVNDLRDMKDVNEDKGIYNVSLTYKLDQLRFNPYYLEAPSSFSVIGGKVNYDFNVVNNKFGFMVHAMETSEDSANKKDGELLEVKAYLTVAGYKATVGYAKTGKENGVGSAASYGDSFVPFEEGDQMYSPDSTTTYLELSKSIASVSLTGLYGITEYGEYEKDELNIWVSYKATSNTKFSVGYAVMNEDEKDISMSDMTQLNAKVVYSF